MPAPFEELTQRPRRVTIRITCMAISEHLASIRALVGNRLLGLPSVSGILKNSEGQVMLVRNTGALEWTTPGGMIEPGERPSESVVRELKEELGVDVNLIGLLGVFSGPEYLIVYPNGDEVNYVTAVFECELVSGTPQPDFDELEACRFFDLDEIEQLPTPPWLKHMFGKIEKRELF